MYPESHPESHPECYPECHPECHPECNPECYPEFQDQWYMVSCYTLMVWSHLEPRKKFGGGGEWVADQI